MANQSIKNAFERMWQHVVAKLGTKADIEHEHTKSEITDFPTSMPASDVSAWAKASTKPTYTYDEVGAAASSHGTHVTFSTTKPVVDGTAAVGTATTVARSDHKHPTDTTRAAASDLTALQTLVGTTAVATQINTAISGITPDDIGAAESSHTHSSYANQNTFSNVKVGSTTIAADTTTDTLTLEAGSNITLTPDATNDKVTIAATDTNTTYTFATGASNGQIKVTPSSGSAVNVSVKGLGSAAYTASTAYDAAGAATTALNSAKSYTDDEIEEWVGTKTVASQISAIPDATTSASGHMSKTDKAKLNATNIAYGTCDTAAATAAKVVTLTGNTNWALTTGSLITVKFTNTNTAASPTLNVNNTGAYPIWYNASEYTSASSYGGYASRHITYQFNGTHWVFVSWSYDTNSDTKVEQAAAITTAGEYPVILAYSTSTSKVTNTVKKASTLTYNPSTKILTAPTFKGALTGNADTATKATQDSSGNIITSTYMTKANPTGTGSLIMNKNGTPGSYATSFGYNNKASGNYSLAGGYQTSATEVCSVALGDATEASGDTSFAMGMLAKATQPYSVAIGEDVRASSANQTVVGKYNIEDAANEYAFIVGNGGSADSRSNALMVEWDGDVHAGQNLTVPNAQGLYTKNSSGDWRKLIGMGTNNNIAIGYDSYLNKDGSTYIYGGAQEGTEGKVVLYVPYMKGSGTTGVYLASTEVNECKCFFKPSSNADVGLGSTSLRWYKLYSASACSTSSDEREKYDIMSIADYPTMYSRSGSGNVFEQLFSKLVPKTYGLNIEYDDKLHIGFVAQDVVSALEEVGIPAEGTGLVDHDEWIDEETGEEKDRYGLAYEEFIALNTYMIQKQQATIEEQQTQIVALEERIAKLEKLLTEQ